MNHLAPFQRSDNRWVYTRNGYPTGYCHLYEPFKADGVISEELANQENARYAPFIHKFHDTGHASREEACDCYKEFLLDTWSHFPTEEPPNASQQYKCEICGNWTSCYASVGAYNIFLVCPEHSNRECVSKLLKINESWES